MCCFRALSPRALPHDLHWYARTTVACATALQQQIAGSCSRGPIRRCWPPPQAPSRSRQAAVSLTPAFAQHVVNVQILSAMGPHGCPGSRSGSRPQHFQGTGSVAGRGRDRRYLPCWRRWLAGQAIAAAARRQRLGSGRAEMLAARLISDRPEDISGALSFFQIWGRRLRDSAGSTIRRSAGASGRSATHHGITAPREHSGSSRPRVPACRQSWPGAGVNPDAAEPFFMPNSTISTGSPNLFRSGPLPRARETAPGRW